MSFILKLRNVGEQVDGVWVPVCASLWHFLPANHTLHSHFDLLPIVGVLER